MAANGVEVKPNSPTVVTERSTPVTSCNKTAKVPYVLPVAFAVVLSLVVAVVVYNRLTINHLKRKLDAYDQLLQLSQRPEDDGDGDGDGHPPNLRLVQGEIAAGTTALVFEWTQQHPKASAFLALATAASALGLAASTPGLAHHPRPPVALPPAISAAPIPLPPAPVSEPAAPSVTTPPSPAPMAVPVNYLQRSPLPRRLPPPSPPAGAKPTTPPSSTPTPTPTIPVLPTLPPPTPPDCGGLHLAVPPLVDACLLG